MDNSIQQPPLPKTTAGLPIAQDNRGREYRYQADWTIANRMFHVRCDNWTEFQEAVANIVNTYNTVNPVQPPAGSTGSIGANGTPAITPVQPQTTTEEPDAVCSVCKSPLLPEKRIVSKKDGRAWWVRDCSSGDRTHKGLIRPAV